MFENAIADHNKENKNELAGVRDILPKKDEKSFNDDNSKPWQGFVPLTVVSQRLNKRKMEVTFS